MEAANALHVLGRNVSVLGKIIFDRAAPLLRLQ
jgi:hypothetical protein